MEELKEDGSKESTILRIQQVKIAFSDGRIGVFSGPAVFQTKEEMIRDGSAARIVDVTFTEPFNFDPNEADNGDGASIPSASSKEDMAVVEGEKRVSEESNKVLPVQTTVPANTKAKRKETTKRVPRKLRQP